MLCATNCSHLLLHSLSAIAESVVLFTTWLEMLMTSDLLLLNVCLLWLVSIMVVRSSLSVLLPCKHYVVTISNVLIT